MSSTYLKWILVAVALAVGVWVVARPSGRSKPDAARTEPAPTDPARTDPARADPARTDPARADPVHADQSAGNDGHAYPAPADAVRFATPPKDTALDSPASDATALDRDRAYRDDETVAAQDGRYVARTSPPPAVARVPAPRAAPDGLPSNGSRPSGESPAQPPAGSAPGSGSALGLWRDGYTEDVRARWRELQLRFIDDPQSVAGEAELVIEEAVASLTASVNARKDELKTWRSGSGDDTEQLRAAVNRYREFLDRLLRV